MIKINLLVARGVRKGAEARKFLMILGLALIVVLGGLGYTWWSQTGQLAALEREIREIKIKLAPLQKQIEEVKKFELRKKELEKKSGIIAELKAAQMGPARTLAEISRSLPDQLWLTTLNDTPQTLEIDGYALSNSDIAIFMKNLESSKIFSSTDLIMAQQTEYEGVKVMRFRVDAKKAPLTVKPAS